MIKELQEMIDYADYTKNHKVKIILLEIAKADEDKQKDLLTLVRIIVNPEKAGDILDKYKEEKGEGNARNK